ncbi:MAG: hypothetical protein ACRESZ_13505 [Methylococcales bacterium]
MNECRDTCLPLAKDNGYCKPLDIRDESRSETGHVVLEHKLYVLGISHKEILSQYRSMLDYRFRQFLTGIGLLSKHEAIRCDHTGLFKYRKRCIH